MEDSFDGLCMQSEHRFLAAFTIVWKASDYLLVEVPFLYNLVDVLCSQCC